jgi:LuxR family transcriptional regulator, maltose regulon positive regulatory protein
MGSTESPSPASRSVRLGAGEVVSRPDLWAQLEASARVTVVSAPAGSGKTVLLQSWIAGADRATRVAWVAVAAGERDPQRFGSR